MHARRTGAIAPGWVIAALGALALVMAGAAPAPAQQPPQQAGPQAAEAFAFLLGEWEGVGEASAPGGGERGEFTVRETIRAEAGGHAVSLRGAGEAEMHSGQPPVRVHDAIGLIWRHHDGGWRMRSVTMHGQSVEAGLTLTDAGFDWGFSAGPMGEFRYSATVRDGVWRETGEFRAPDGEWTEFLVMTLTRIGD